MVWEFQVKPLKPRPVHWCGHVVWVVSEGGWPFHCRLCKFYANYMLIVPPLKALFSMPKLRQKFATENQETEKIHHKKTVTKKDRHEETIWKLTLKTTSWFLEISIWNKIRLEDYFLFYCFIFLCLLFRYNMPMFYFSFQVLLLMTNHIFNANIDCHCSGPTDILVSELGEPSFYFCIIQNIYKTSLFIKHQKCNVGLLATYPLIK